MWLEQLPASDILFGVIETPDFLQATQFLPIILSLFSQLKAVLYHTVTQEKFLKAAKAMNQTLCPTILSNFILMTNIYGIY